MRKAVISRVFKRVVAVVTGVVLLLSAFPLLPALADDVDTQAELLDAIKNNKAITLTADITLSGTWSTPANTYSATFNGQGHIISGISAPLISTLSGTVQNVGLMCVDNMDGEGMLAKTSSGTVTGVFAYGKMKYTIGTNPMGGMIGEVTAGTVSNCFSCIDITTSKAAYIGGLIGKLSGGTLSNCYSSGAVKSSSATSHTAGLAYAYGLDSSTKQGIVNGTIENTYSSVQLVSATPYAKPSGVNGLYDNQLSIVRESVSNAGLSTRALMDENTLGDAFAVTSTAYPALVHFYNKMWGSVAQHIVRVSTAAAAFTDVDSSKRMEPSTAFVARADYLLAETVVDRTNIASLTWDVNSAYCQVYDTVPFTADNGAVSAGTSADLLRSKLVFSSDASGVAMTAASGPVKRTWYLTVKRTANPYFASGKGTSGSVFKISSKTQLQYVRYYTRIASAYYTQTASFSVGSSWPPITDFRGIYDGGNYELYGMTSVKNDGEAGFGLFGTTYATSTIKNIRLRAMRFVSNGDNSSSVPAGILVGKANSTLTVQNISLSGNNCSISGNANAYIGGLVGHAVGKLTMTNCLVSIQIKSGLTTGGLVGYMPKADSAITKCGVTGYVTGTKYIGGLVGRAATSTIQNCFSTAAVVSDAAASSNYAGGLVGYATTATTIKNSYCAALTDAPSFTGKGVIVGCNGVIDATVYYDKVYLVGTASGQNANATALSTKQLIAQTIDSSVWTKDSKHYPQITDHTTAESFKYISPVATLPIYFQQYWQDTETGDVTTGFITDTALYSTSTITVEKPAAISGLNTATPQIYTFTNGTDSGYGMQPAAGQTRMMLWCKTRSSTDIADDDNLSGIRVIAVARDDLVPLKYTVTGVSGARAYVELYYSTDKTNWQGSGVMTTSGETAKVLYDMPKGSYVKVKVTTADDYKVSSVKIGGTTYSTATNGFYVSSGTFSSSTSVTVTLASNAPPWGLRRQTH